ncbi:acetyl-CoA carboxylase biotin carboxyl carrier protein [Candidatus Bipolaricaulota bacterium]|nr:acetyl-CoA carboxylase biotin carboxyl carrier protein [Candidatus Bipolaricaulota bacterium]
MDLNIDQMKELIDLFETSDLTEISVSQNDYQVTLKKDSGSRSRLSGSSSAPGDEVREREIQGSGPEETTESRPGKEGPLEESVKEENVITSPIVGTFYRSPSPEEPSYIEVGDRVEEGDTVCIIEAMKVMNEVKAERGGEVIEICVEDGDPVEYGQNLFKLAPTEKGS